MKKLMIASAIGALSAAAFAQQTQQPGVTIYGSLDAGAAYISNIAGGKTTRLDQGTMQPDRIGFRGAEDLGGGMRAIFQLESGFATDTGALINSTTFFNRYAAVGLSGNFGILQIGHMPDMVFDYAGKLSNGFQLTNFYLFHPGNLDNLANTFQFNNAIKYTSPTFSGFQVSGMYGLGEVAGNFNSGRNLSAGINYANGPLRAALAYTKNNDRPAGFAGTYLSSVGLGTAATIFSSLRTVAAGAGYTIGDVRLNALYTQVKIDLPTGANPTQKNGDLGVAWRYTTANTLNVGYSQTRLDGARWNQYSLENVYAFSKRTEWYVQAAYQRASGDARFAIQNNTGISSTQSQLVTTIGIHTVF